MSKKKLVLMTGAAAIALLASGGAKATVYTLTGTGTTDYGTDGLGIFGTAGGDLGGLPFSMVMTFTSWADIYSNDYESYLDYAYATTTVTVGGQTYAFTTTAENGYSWLGVTDALHVLGNSPPGNVCTLEGEPENCDGLEGYSYTNGSPSTNNSLDESLNSNAFMFVGSDTDDFITQATLDQYIDHAIIPAEDDVVFSFQVCNADDTVCSGFDDPMTTITLNYGAVPEPASLSLFGAALVWLGLARRRRRG